MGFYTADGAVVNAAPESPFVEGAATIGGACSVAPAATRTQFSGALLSAALLATATAFATLPLEATTEGVAQLYLSPTKIHSVKASAEADAHVSVFVTRFVDAEVELAGRASIQAIAADEIGAADCVGRATIAPDATRIVRPRSAGYADAVVTAVSTHTRLPEAHLAATGALYAEVGINGVYEAYGPVTATATVEPDPLNFKFSGDVQVDVLGEAAPAGQAIRTQMAESDPIAVSFVVVAEPTVAAIPFSVVAAQADLVADAIRVVPTDADFFGAAEAKLTKHALIRHAASADCTATGDIAADIAVLAYGEIEIDSTCSVSAEGVLVKVPKADLFGNASVEVDDTVTTYGVSTINGVGVLDPTGVRVVVPTTDVSAVGAVDASVVRFAMSVADVTGAAEVTPVATRFVEPDVGLGANATFVAEGRVTRSGNVDFTLVASIIADSFANIDSQDPDCRTFYRLAEQTEFTRPEEIFEFTRRCA